MQIPCLARFVCCALLASIAFKASADGQPACSLQRVRIAADVPGVFVGRASGLEIVLQNERPDKETEVFADSAIELRRPVANAACSVPGGVWARNDFFVANDGRTVVAHESDGSNDSLVFIDGRNCRRVGEIDVSGVRWQLRERSLRIEPLQGRAWTRQLDAACRPRRAKN